MLHIPLDSGCFGRVDSKKGAVRKVDHDVVYLDCNELNSNWQTYVSNMN